MEGPLAVCRPLSLAADCEPFASATCTRDDRKATTPLDQCPASTTSGVAAGGNQGDEYRAPFERFKQRASRLIGRGRE